MPKYVPPVAKESRLDKQLAPDVEEKLAKKTKNFLQHNITMQRKIHRSPKK